MKPLLIVGVCLFLAIVQFLAADPDFAEVGVPGGCFHFVNEDGEWKYRGQFNE